MGQPPSPPLTGVFRRDLSRGNGPSDLESACSVIQSENRIKGEGHGGREAENRMGRSLSPTFAFVRRSLRLRAVNISRVGLLLAPAGCASRGVPAGGGGGLPSTPDTNPLVAEGCVIANILTYRHHPLHARAPAVHVNKQKWDRKRGR